ncbi:MAG: HIT family protein [Candidatus Campbellbacteria bacterium]|nr:HIT family protein [Candidatus Campbellbacteria bacterium]
MSDCIFCKIVAGKIPAEKVYEDEYTFAFLDLNPVNPGHTLVLPKKHFLNIFDTPEETLSHVVITAKKVATALKKTGCDGVNIVSNNGGISGQIVFHAHIHVIPRLADDGREQWHGKPYAEGEMQQTGEKIRNAFI